MASAVRACAAPRFDAVWAIANAGACAVPTSATLDAIAAMASCATAASRSAAAHRSSSARNCVRADALPAASCARADGSISSYKELASLVVSASSSRSCAIWCCGVLWGRVGTLWPSQGSDCVRQVSNRSEKYLEAPKSALYLE